MSASLLMAAVLLALGVLIGLLGLAALFGHRDDRDHVSAGWLRNERGGR